VFLGRLLWFLAETNLGARALGQMIKKKAKSRAKKNVAKKTKKTATKTSAKKKSRGRSRKDLNPAEVRKDIAKIVGSGAKEMTVAVMNEAMKGQLAPAKYLFEVAGVYPPANDGTQATQEEDCLAKTLLDRLNAPPNLPPKAAEKESDPQNIAPKVPDITRDDTQTGAGKGEVADTAASDDTVTVQVIRI
jgi:hypothetical protein